MHELLDVRPWPQVLLRYPLLILTALLLGALASFAYSYAPLHRSKDWQISYLEERLETRDEQVRALEEELAAAQSSLEGTPSGEEVLALQARLTEAQRLTESHVADIAALEKKLERANDGREQWKRKHAAAVADLEELQASAEDTPSGPALDGEPIPSESPAAPAPEAHPPVATPDGDDPRLQG